MGQNQKSEAVAGFLQIIPGFGAGRFYLGDWKIGLFQLFSSFLLYGTIWCFIDGIVLLSKNGRVRNAVTAVITDEGVRKSVADLGCAGKGFLDSFDGMEYNTDEKYFGNEYYEEWGDKRFAGKTYGRMVMNGTEARCIMIYTETSCILTNMASCACENELLLS